MVCTDDCFKDHDISDYTCGAALLEIECEVSFGQHSQNRPLATVRHGSLRSISVTIRRFHAPRLQATFPSLWRATQASGRAAFQPARLVYQD